METKTVRANLLIEAFRKVRALTLRICAPLEIEDYVIQSMPDTSPSKWHLAHTTWFFETFLLARFKTDFKAFDPQFHFLFNSYYKSLGAHYYRPNRGLLSRPGLNLILKYRATIDEEVSHFLESCSIEVGAQAIPILILGLNHEEQHQELLLTDIKHLLCITPTHPVYQKKNRTELNTQQPDSPSGLILNSIRRSINAPAAQHPWVSFEGGLHSIGALEKDFSFDNERPRHRVFLGDFCLASRLVTNIEYIEFIESKAYSRPELWLSLGWDTLLENHWECPLYWLKQGDQWWTSTLNGFEPLDPDEPVSHISFYEADAYARWKGVRLPTEPEWEVAAQVFPIRSMTQVNDLSSGSLRPLPSTSKFGIQQLFGDTWEWTSSAYLPYPGYKPLIGPEGEYNGKFMSNQMILRGGSCVTPHGHIRPTYRNFFPPHIRWQFTGIRLAKDSSDAPKVEYL